MRDVKAGRFSAVAANHPGQVARRLLAGWWREYALSDMQKPMGLTTYTLSHTLPEALRGKLPSIEQLQRELGLDAGADESAQAGRAEP